MRQKHVLLTRGPIRWRVRAVNAAGAVLSEHRYFSKKAAKAEAESYAKFYDVKVEVL